MSLTTRGRALRAKILADTIKLLSEHKQVKKSLRPAFKKSKKAYKMGLCTEVEFTKRISDLSINGVINKQDVRHIVGGLFLTHLGRWKADDLEVYVEKVITEFT